jgi:hypothetical protein
MTHDETYQTDKFDELRLKILNSFEKPVKIALLAVVELHKPSTHKHGLVFCNANCEGDYPCPTIQVIEKELG